MTEKNTQTQNPTQIHSAFFRKLIEEQSGRIEGFYQELARLEQQGLDQARAAIDELARLLKDSLEQAAQVSAEWRKLAVAASYKASEVVEQNASC